MVFCGCGIFQPEQAVGLQVFAQARGLNGREAVVHIVQQVQLRPGGGADFLKQLRRVAQVFFGGPIVLTGQVRIRWLVKHGATAHAVDLVQARHTALRAHRPVAHGLVAQHFVHRVGNVPPVCMAVDHDPRSALAPEQLVQRHASRLGLDVPQGGVHRRNCAHGDRPATPIGALVEVLPDVFNLPGIPADQTGDQVVIEVADHRQLAPIECGVANAAQTRIGFDFQGHEVASGTAHNNLGSSDFHGGLSL